VGTTGPKAHNGLRRVFVGTTDVEGKKNHRKERKGETRLHVNNTGGQIKPHFHLFQASPLLVVRYTKHPAERSEALGGAERSREGRRPDSLAREGHLRREAAAGGGNRHI